MISETLPSFWKLYKRLDQSTKTGARKAYKLWFQNPFHPSLHFKCINREEKIWAARVTLVYRAIGIFDGDTVTWF